MNSVHIARQNGREILIVEGKPFIMLSGEVHNSSSSSLEYMEQVYDKADALGLNSLLLPVTWELVEPEEGILFTDMIFMECHIQPYLIFVKKQRKRMQGRLPC